jgi:DNA-binding transcriptional regulator YiaG
MMTIEVMPLVKAPRPGDRLCIACNRVKPANQFHVSGHGNGRKRTCIRCQHDAARRERIARGGKDRHPRYNARGDVWCNRCERYLGAENFKRHPNRPGTYWAYCKPCTREIDRERYAKRTSTIEGAIAELDRKNQRKQRLTKERMAERRKFLKESILLLRRRGLTKAEIVRLTDTTFGNLLKWERGEMQRPTEAICRRFGVVVRATHGFPLGEPAHRRRLPHPAMAELLAICMPQIEAIPVRNSWKNGGRS